MFITPAPHCTAGPVMLEQLLHPPPHPYLVRLIMKWSGKLSALWSGIVESRPCCFVNAVKELIVFFSEESLWSEAVFSIQTMLPYKVGWMLVKEAALCGRVVPRWSPELAVRAKINTMKEGERGRQKQTSVFWCFHARKKLRFLF